MSYRNIVRDRCRHLKIGGLARHTSLAGLRGFVVQKWMTICVIRMEGTMDEFFADPEDWEQAATETLNRRKSPDAKP